MYMYYNTLYIYNVYSVDSLWPNVLHNSMKFAGVCLHIHVHVLVYIHVHVYIYMHTYNTIVTVYVHMYWYTYMYMYTYMHTYTCNTIVTVYVHMWWYTCNSNDQSSVTCELNHYKLYNSEHIRNIVMSNPITQHVHQVRLWTHLIVILKIIY